MTSFPFPARKKKRGKLTLLKKGGLLSERKDFSSSIPPVRELPTFPSSERRVLRWGRGGRKKPTSTFMKIETRGRLLTLTEKKTADRP